MARFLKDTPRVKTLQLEWPVEVDGTEYLEISLKRMTAGEVAAFLKEIKDDDKDVRFPIFIGADGKQISGAVLDSLDDDDMAALSEAATDFLPRRFRAATEPASAPADGGPTAPSSGG